MIDSNELTKGEEQETGTRKQEQEQGTKITLHLTLIDLNLHSSGQGFRCTHAQETPRLHSHEPVNSSTIPDL